MNSRITARIAEVRALLKRVTPGPWRAEWRGNGVNLKVKDWMIGSLGTEFIDEDCPVIPAEEIEANGELFAASRELVPALLKVIEKLIEQRDFEIGLSKTNIRYRDLQRDAYDAEIADLLEGKEGK